MVSYIGRRRGDDREEIYAGWSTPVQRYDMFGDQEKAVRVLWQVVHLMIFVVGRYTLYLHGVDLHGIPLW